MGGEKQRGVLWILAAVALAMTLLNALKPLHIDDPFIHDVAEHIVEAPLDPYGFDIFWMQWPQPVFEELTPPVVPYWWSIAMGVFGDRPFVWKLWMYPFALLFCVALYSVLRRFTPDIALPLVLMTAGSPAILPSINFMQDIPALALGLSGLALYLRAAERGRIPLAIASGLVCALAAQTKFTALTVPMVILVHGAIFRRRGLALTTVLAATLLFAAWEGWMTLKYGQGMFAGQLGSDLYWYRRSAMLVPLIRLLGALAPLLAVVAAAAAGLRWSAPVGSVAVVACFAGLTMVPMAAPLYTLFGVIGGLVLAAVAVHLLTVGGDRSSWFVVLWVMIEVVGFFATAPFPAVRRVLGLLVALTVMVGYFASRRTEKLRLGGGMVWPVAASVLLGLAVFSVDRLEATAQRDAANVAAERVRTDDPGARIWYLGHWGFQFYAGRAGMHPVIPDSSLLASGDWLVVPGRVHLQEVSVGEDVVGRVDVVDIEDRWPLATNLGFYGGSTPLVHHEGPRQRVQIFRVRKSFVPRTSWTPTMLNQWVMASSGRTAAAAVPALVRYLNEGGTADRRLAARTLVEIGPGAEAAAPALSAAMSDADPEVRRWAAEALRRIGEGTLGPAAPL